MLTKLLLLALVAFTARGASFPQTVDVAALTWRTNVIAVSTHSGNTFFAVNQLALDLKRQGIYHSRIYSINPRAGNDLTASLVCLTNAGNNTELNSGTFLAGDYVESSGLTGNGLPKYINSRINPRTLSVSTNDISLWAAVYTTQTMGTTRALIGNNDSGNISFLGVLNAGLQETGVIGASAAAEYPAGSATSLTGLLGANTKTFPIRMLTTSTTTNVLGLQGIATDGTNQYEFDTTKIFVRDYVTKSLISSNTSPFTGAATGNNHLGDGEYYNGKLYVSSCLLGSGQTVASNNLISVYDSVALTLTTNYSVQSQTDNASAVAVDTVNSAIYVAGYWHTRPIYKYDLTSGAYLGFIYPQANITNIQGMVVTNGYIIVTADNTPADTTASLYAVRISDGGVQKLYSTAISGLNEIEGITIYQTNVVFVYRTSTPTTNAITVGLDFATIKSSHSSMFFQDGLAVGVPQLGVNGLGNSDFGIQAALTSGTPASYSNRRIGLTAIMKGLEPSEVYPFSRSVIRFDKALGRR